MAAASSREEWESGIDDLDAFEDLQPCRVYQPDGADHPQTPSKKARRAVRPPQLDSKQSSETRFSSLFDGHEDALHVESRLRVFESVWGEQQILFENVIAESNAAIIDNVTHFLQNVEPSRCTQIPVCLLVTGPAVTNYGSIYESIAENLNATERSIVLSLKPSDAPNLKTALKHIIQQDTASTFEDDSDDGAVDSSRSKQAGVRYLNYDLQLLHNHVQSQSVSRIIVSFSNSEAFDGQVLDSLVEILQFWKTKLPWVLVFEIATSVENFQSKLSQQALRCLQGTEFETVDADESLELIFRAATAPDVERSLWISSALGKMLLDRQKYNIQSVQFLVESCKFAYITHFFTNPLSILLDPDLNPNSFQPMHYEAIRALASFKKYAEPMKKQKTQEALALLKDDESFVERILEMLAQARKSIEDLLAALDIVSQIQSYTSDLPGLTWADLYIQGMSGTLANSPELRQIMLLVRKLPSDTMQDMLERIADSPNIDISEVQSDLSTLAGDLTSDGTLLRSEYDDHHKSLQTAIVGQKVQLKRRKAALSKGDAAYSAIVDHVNTHLSTFFTQYLVDPKELPLHELLLVDSRKACKEAFAPAPRAAVERALSAPRDYLACDCCPEGANALSPTHPATAILYQLYLESGSLINIADLWSAFAAIIGTEDKEGEAEEEQTLALFYRAMAELKYLGLIKNSRKKIDHLAKLAWKGL